MIKIDNYYLRKEHISGVTGIERNIETEIVYGRYSPKLKEVEKDAGYKFNIILSSGKILKITHKSLTTLENNYKTMIKDLEERRDYEK